MSAHPRAPGAAAIGRLDELPPLERRVIRCLRLWCAGAGGEGRFDELMQMAARHARRPLLAHAPDCPCAGADECVFARFVALAAEGAREDAILMAVLMVRADVACGLAGLAETVGLGLMRGTTPRIVQ